MNYGELNNLICGINISRDRTDDLLRQLKYEALENYMNYYKEKARLDWLGKNAFKWDIKYAINYNNNKNLRELIDQEMEKENAEKIN
jgi:hypothetical protein